MKYLSIKNRVTETAPDITGDMNHDETTISQHKMTQYSLMVIQTSYYMKLLT